MPKHRQPTPHRVRARPVVVTAGALALVLTAAGAALATTAADAPTADATAPTTAPTISATASSPTTASADGETATASRPATTNATPGGAWLSGASGDGAADGTLGDWRGQPVQIVGTWADQGDNQTELYPIAPGGEVADWTGPLDIAPGGLQGGDTWDAAATGAYDDRWRQSLTRMAELRAGDATTYIRPFHEFNLDGWDWSVTPDQADAFTTAWKRYRTIQQEVFPQAKLVYGVNVTSSGTDLDWRTTWPGAGEADVLGVDTYNGWPTITSAADFDAQLHATGANGIPVGLDAYSQQAADWGVPLAVPEWSGRAEMGDEPAFVTGMHDWFAAHAGNGPGQLAYEILFNALQDDGNFQLYADDTRMPESSQTYRQDFSDAGTAADPSTTTAPGAGKVPADDAADPVDNQPAAGTEATDASDGSDVADSSPIIPTDATAAPTEDLPGWRHVFSDDFTTDAPAGTFLSANSHRWGAYDDLPDTSGTGTYSADAISNHDGVMDLHIGNIDGKVTAAAPFPLINGTNGSFGQTYGRYSVRFTADPLIGMHMAWLLWPDDDSGPDKGWSQGEVDFPEADLDDTISVFNHCPGNPTQNCLAKTTDVSIASGWHTATTEWSPDGVTFILDGTVLGTSPEAPTSPMHWVLQTETELGRTPTTDGRVLADWVSVWSRDGTSGTTEAKRENSAP